MRAAVVHSPGGGFVIEDVSVDVPRDSEVLLAVRAVGLCHSDLTLASSDLGFAMPAVFGHEVAGVVEAVGPGVRSVAVGDHVVGALVRYCGECERCLSGRSYYCRHGERTARAPGEPARLRLGGADLNQAFGLGAFAEQALVHENQLAKVPDSLPFEQAALLGCGVITGAGAVLNTAAVGRGETVVVIGAGGVGLNAVSAAVVAGASAIVVVDLSETTLERARHFGATDSINATTTDPVEALWRILPAGADHVFDFVGAARVLEQAMRMLSYGGALYLVGIGGRDVHLTIDVMPFMRNRNRVESVYMGSANLRVDVPYFARLAASGSLRLGELVSETIPLDAIGGGYERLGDGSVARVVVTNP